MPYDAGQQQSIVIAGASSEAVRMLIDYLYGGCQQHSAVSLFQISNMYGVTSLTLRCVHALTVLLTPDNLPHLERLAEEQYCSKLAQVGHCCSCFTSVMHDLHLLLLSLHVLSFASTSFTCQVAAMLFELIRATGAVCKKAASLQVSGVSSLVMQDMYLIQDAKSLYNKRVSVVQCSACSQRPETQ